MIACEYKSSYEIAQIWIDGHHGVNDPVLKNLEYGNFVMHASLFQIWIKHECAINPDIYSIANFVFLFPI